MAISYTEGCCIRQILCQGADILWSSKLMAIETTYLHWIILGEFGAPSLRKRLRAGRCWFSSFQIQSLRSKYTALAPLPSLRHDNDACDLLKVPSLEGNVDWFDFWLNGHEDPDPTKVEQYLRWRALRDEQSEAGADDHATRSGWR